MKESNYKYDVTYVTPIIIKFNLYIMLMSGGRKWISITYAII